MKQQLNTDFYNKEYYLRHRKTSKKSAEFILGEIFKHLDVDKIIDIGCGDGAWLKVAQDLGVRVVKGVDGKWVNSADLCFDKKFFVETDLTQPFNVDDKFDLAISLEVAADIPVEYEKLFISELIKLSDFVLFSAGNITQTHKPHKNRQPQSHWRKLFEAHNYKPVDVVRSVLWEENEINPCYIQNVCLYVSQERIKDDKRMEELHERYKVIPADIYHRSLLPPSINDYRIRTLVSAIFQKIFRKRLL